MKILSGYDIISAMWGRCFEQDLDRDLFGLVVQYEIDSASGRAVICAPRAGYTCDADKIHVLSQTPEYVYGEEVVPRNHPRMRGVIAKIQWHYNRQQFFYIIRIAGRLKSKRYYKEDLMKPEE